MPSAPRILALNYNRRNLEVLGQFLAKAGFEPLPTQTLEDVDKILASGVEVRLALLDLAGFDSRLWERCDRLRQRGIPFFVISPGPGAETQQARLKSGAASVLVKPLSAQALLTLIKTLVKP
ncbi:MAG: response regulator [Limisphaerales bacterium]